MSKADYVLRQPGDDGRHHCHWPGCTRRVKPAMWGCREHWYSLPHEIRTRIWRAYEPGQEISKSPSREYLEAARAAREWAEKHGRATAAEGQEPLL